MLELDNAAKAAKLRISELESQLDTTQKQLAAEKIEKSQAHGRIAQLETQLALEAQKSDHHLRWATTVTAQVHSIGMFANEAMRIARKEITDAGVTVPASKTNGEVLEAIDRELSTTAADLRKANDESERPMPSFLTAGPRPLRHE